MKNNPITPRGTVQSHDISINLLKANDFVADGIRKEMKGRNILLINLVSSPGSGKTALLEATAAKLKDKLKMAVLVGDLETERDADRIKKQGIPALQIVTGGICHLEAQMIHQVLDQIPLDELDILFIENVGNLVCPSSFDLGEDIRVTLIAVTEGDDKPKKYPKMFLTSDMMMVTKMDLLPYVPFSLDAVTKDAREVNHEIEIMMASSLKGNGVDEWCDYLMTKAKEKKSQAKVTIAE
ncbi:hydrogenase nickel incorporation protein HypB [Catalinimonas sp. 4WD22]|uniref:hydrogenase nickel incorporation protein HypB n=1 Tax=Catalinimonas locisalis TaxID=3133978 RepID=UPI003100C4F4